MIRILMAAALSGLLAAPALAQDPVQVKVLTDPPDAIVQFTYSGSIAHRALPVAVVENFGDLGTQRVKMKLNQFGTYEGETFLNREGTFRFHIEGEDLRTGARLRDDNGGKFYSFEVTNPEIRAAREKAIRAGATKLIRRDLPQFRNAEIFFNNRQTTPGARTAIVRAADGRSVYRVLVDNAGRRKVSILEQVK